MTAESTTWVIRGARPLGGDPADITLAGATITLSLIHISEPTRPY